MNHYLRFGVAFVLGVTLTLAACDMHLLPTVAAAAPLSLRQQKTEAARVALREGKALLRRGKSNEAIIKLEAALASFTAAKETRGEAATHDALGELYERGGQYVAALGHYESAHQAFRRAASETRAGDAVVAGVTGIGDASGNLYNADLMLAKIGNMQLRSGDITAATRAFERMNAEKPETPQPIKSVKSAKGLFGRVASAASGIRPDAAAADRAKSVTRDAAGTVSGVIELYRQLIVYSTHEIGLGRIAYLGGDLDAAKTHFENALAAAGGGSVNLNVVGRLGQSSRFRVAARTALGDVAFGQNRFADAVKLYEQAAGGAEADGRLDLMWSAQRGLGRSRWALAANERNAGKKAKLRTDALAAYRTALATIERIRVGSLQADEARSTFLATTGDVFSEASAYMAEMALMEAESAPQGAPLTGTALEHAAEAFRVVELGRARSLLDLLGETGTEITEGVPADLIRQRRENLERQQAIAAELTGLSLDAGATARPPAETEAELARLAVEYDKLENAIRQASPRYAALTAPQPLTVAELQHRVLDEGTMLLEYSLGDPHSYLWAITPQSLTLHRLPARATLERGVESLRAQIVPVGLRRSIVSLTAGQSAAGSAQTGGASAAAPGNAAAFVEASHALYKAILEPAAVGKRRLLIVADGALNYVPFAALVTSGANPRDADYGQLPYLIKTNEVVNAPSASVIAAVDKNGKVQKGTGGVLVIADPVFNTDDPRAKTGAQKGSTPATRQNNDAAGSRNAPALESALRDVAQVEPRADTSRGLPLVRLSGSRAEADQIAQLARAANMKADVWLDLDASEANLDRRDISGYRVLHIATHGVLNAERPQFTGLVLSLVGTADAPGADGFLRTDEIFNLRLGAPLVMLSACESGLGRERRGEGVIGLTRAFMYAGAPTVGVSLWSVSDRSTALLMTDFYKRLLADGDAAHAASLREAQLAMLANPRYNAPFFWAPFVLVGSWR